MSWYQPPQSLAAERYQRRSFVLLLFFAAMLFAMRSLRHQVAAGRHLSTPALFAASGLFALPLAGVAVAMGAYLTEERDEFQRNIEVRGLLAGAGALLVVSVFFGFLHELGWPGSIEPVTAVLTFGMLNAAVKLVYRFRAEAQADD